MMGAQSNSSLLTGTIVLGLARNISHIVGDPGRKRGQDMTANNRQVPELPTQQGMARYEFTWQIKWLSERRLDVPELFFFFFFF